MLSSLRSFALLLALVFCLSACGGGGDDEGNDSGGGKVRFLNAIPELEDVQLFLGEDNEPRILRYGQLTEYIDADEQRLEVRLFIPASPLALIDQAVATSPDVDRTVIFTGPATLPRNSQDYKISLTTLSDVHEPPVDQRFLLRVVNASPSAGNLNIYLTKPNEPLDSVIPKRGGVGYRAESGYLEGNESSAVLTLIDTKSKRTIYQSPLLDLAGTPVTSVFVLDKLDRGLPVVVGYSKDSDL